MKKSIHIGLAFLFLAICGQLQAQPDPPELYEDHKGAPIVIASGAIIAVGSLLWLNEIWYKEFERAPFHSFNDNKEWMQMDKLGHVFTSYQVGALGHGGLNSLGIDANKSLLWGGSIGLIYLTGIEVLDGYSAEWGFSFGDGIANVVGAAWYIGQQKLWNEERITPKFSYQPSSYASYRQNILGSSETERLFKDYNGQTYWLSCNLNSFMKIDDIPNWLNLALGHGADGMIYAEPNVQETSIYADLNTHSRQWHLSLDADLHRIPTRSKFLKTTFRVLSIIKIPAPGISYNRKSGLKVHGMIF